VEESLQKIHDASMVILREVGVRFHHPSALSILGDHGVQISHNTAFFTENQIMDWVRKAPRSFTLHARNPDDSIVIGGDATHYAPAYGAIYLVQGNGNLREPLLSDYVKFAKLIHQSAFFNVNGGILVQPSDVKPEFSAPVMLYCSTVLSDKGIIAATGGPEATEMIMDMVAILFGERLGASSSPRMIAPVNTLSPLQIDDYALHTLMTYAQNGQPTFISPCAMAGTTGPVTLAGTIALSNAEALAGIVLTEMINPGVPVLYGFQSTAADLKTGSITIGGPERSLCIAYGARLAKAYGLPSRGGGADNDALDVSEQSGYESMMAMLITRREKVNFVLHSAGMAASYAAMSYRQFIVGLEMLAMIERYMQGLKIDRETLAVDVIKQVGIGGEFLSHPHTLGHFREELWVPEIGRRGQLGRAYDENLLNTKIDSKLDRMLSDYRKPELSESVQSDLHAYLTDRGINTDMIDRLLP
jgi:trimethylamine--corrinoid protein Co-methyltransferase